MHCDVETVTIASDGLGLYGRLRHHRDTAPTVVLLCGLGFHTFEYEPLAEHLAAAGLNSLSFDYRGHGHSPGPRGRWTLAELVADCRHTIDFLDRVHPGPAVLFGNSLGAMVAILAATDDGRPLAVAAANAPARAGDFLLTPTRRLLYGLLRRAEPVLRPRISVNHFIPYEHLIGDPAWLSTIRHDPLIEDSRRFSARTYRDLLETWDGPQAVRALHKPVLVLQGRNDQMQPPDQSRLIMDAANEPKRFELLDTGHLPHLEDPATVARLLAEWLSTISRSP